MKITPAIWDIKQQVGIRKIASETLKEFKCIKVGECVRVEHDDLVCQIGTGVKQANCSLRMIIKRFRDQFDWDIEFYHENQYVAIVRRNK